MSISEASLQRTGFLRALAIGCALLVGCRPTADAPDLPDDFPPETPPAHEIGQAVFNASCISCHGASALGTEQGPPLVHRVYRPAHHADQAFVLAVRRGVRAHHWGYGDMPPVPSVTDEEIAAAVGYIRWLQGVAGIE